MAFDELRVHGVSGTPPRDLLNTDPITSAKDDDYTKVYRPHDAIHGHDPNAQAFHWGGLTAGNRWTALWIFLSPFALVNVGGWLVRERSLRATIAIRLAAAMLTGVFVAQLVNGVAILELWVYRRAPDAERLVGFLAVVVALALVCSVRWLDFDAISLRASWLETADEDAVAPLMRLSATSFRVWQ